MNFEVLQKSHLKRNVLIGIAVIFVISACILTFSLAKYRNTKSIQIAKGTINYIPYDLNVLAIYAEGEKQEEIPSGNYILSDQSYCTVDNKKDDSITLTYEPSTQTLSITPMKKEGTKCTLYFSRVLKDAIVADNTLQTATPDFSKIAQNDCTGIDNCEETNGLYQTTDADGTTYYFRGAVDNNWVQFAGFYWRIIRINGDGSIRMIYSGIDSGSITDANRTGSTTTIGQSAFNEKDDDNAYVGYMYGIPDSDTYEETHANINNSKIKTVLDEWYQNNLLSYSNYISKEAGFCGDRSIHTGTGISTDVTKYNAYDRLLAKKNPSFYCNNTNDLYTISSSTKGNKALTYPIALITADELAYI